MKYYEEIVMDCIWKEMEPLLWTIRSERQAIKELLRHLEETNDPVDVSDINESLNFWHKKVAERKKQLHEIIDRL